MKKRSFDKTFYRCVYTNARDIDTDMIALARRMDKVTFNKKFLNPDYVPDNPLETCINEIYFSDPWKYTSIKHWDVLEPPHPWVGNVRHYLINLVECLKSALLDLLDPCESYLFLHSAGYDSRILSAAMAEIRDRFGVGRLGNIHFRCHQPECDSFKIIMEREGWDKHMYSCWEGPKKDYYDIGRSDISVNGWVPYNQQMNFWSDIVPEDEEKNHILITGLGGELFKYIAKFKPKDHRYHLCDNPVLNGSMNYTPNRGEWETQYYHRFKDYIQPFYHFSYLAHASRINPMWCDYYNDRRVDSIRWAMAGLYPYKIQDIPHGIHKYTWEISKERKKQMMDLYHASEFYKEFKLRIDPFKDLYKRDARIWAFAVTVWEKIKKL